MIGNTQRNELIRGISIPDSYLYEDYIGVIHQLPDTDNPYTFGLPDNSERSVQRARSAAVRGQLRLLSSVTVEMKKFDRDQWRTSLAPILDLWKKLVTVNPEAFERKDVNETQEIISKLSELDPLNAFGIMEENSASDLCCSV